MQWVQITEQQCKKVLSSGHSSLLSGMKKVTLGVQSNVETDLLQYLGVPSNFKLALTTNYIKLHQHKIQHVLTIPPPKVRPFFVA